MNLSRRGFLSGLAAVAIAAAPAQANTVWTTFGFASTGSSTARTAPDRWADIKNILDFGADPSGVTDSATPILNAIIAAGGQGVAPSVGGMVFVPPGNFTILSSLYSNAGYISIVGADQHASVITAGHAGFAIDQNGGENSGPNRSGQIDRIAFLTVNNNYVSSGFDPTVGAIRYNVPSASVLIDHCNISGWNGVQAIGNSFNGLINACEIAGPTLPGSIGCCIANWSINASSIGGFWVGVQVSGTGGAVLSGSRIESCATGVTFGLDENNSNRACNGGSIDGLSTERCNDSIYVVAAGATSIMSAILTGTIGAPWALSSISWATGVATVTLSGTTTDAFGWTSGTKTLTISQNTNTGGRGPWDLGNAFVTATRTGTTTFTYPLVSDPGAYPGVNAFSAQWSLKQSTGLKMRGASSTFVSGVTVSIQAANLLVAGVDLFTDGADSGTNNTLVSVIAPNWNAPRSTSKANYQYTNCNEPKGVELDARGVQFGMLFADLPGQSGVIQATPHQSTSFFITDGNQATIGQAVTAGSGSNASYVGRSASAWLRGAF